MGGIGAGLFFIALGAILRYAVTADLSWIRLDIVGDVLMSVGVASIVITLLIYWSRRRGTEVVRRQVYDEQGRPVTGEVMEERRTFDEPPDLP